MRIAIVGGGAAGVLCAIHVLRTARRHSKVPPNLVLFEKHHKQLFRGIAYSTPFPEHVLNVPSQQMSLFSDQPTHYVDWLRENSDQAEMPFSSRLLFGRYLEDSLRKEIRISDAQVDFQHILEAVSDIQPFDRKWSVVTESGKSLSFDKVILATGNLRPREPQELAPNAAQHPLYFPDPWSFSAQRFPADSSILFIGTGLSMIDGLIYLSSLHHRGSIVAFSRKGLLSQPHGSKAPAHISIEELEALSSIRCRLKYLRESVRRHEGAGGSWQDVMAAVRHNTQRLWQSLHVKERRRFLRHLKSYWEVHRHRAPRPQIDLINRLVLSGQLFLRKDHLQSITHDGRSFLVSWRSGRISERFDVIVNSTGPIHDFRTQPVEPYLTLLSKCLVRPDALGLGLEVDKNLNLVGNEGPKESLFAIGSLTKGRFWEVTAIPDIRVQTETIAGQIALDLTSNRSEAALRQSTDSRHEAEAAFE